MSVTTVDIPDELKARIKALAASEHRSMNATILVALEEYAEQQERRAKVRTLARRVADEHGELLDRLAQ